MKVEKLKAYHLSLCDYELGTHWPSINRIYQNYNRKETEEIIEAYREASTVLISRESSLFVCSTIDNVKLWAIKKFKVKRPYLYTLELTGELYWVDASLYEKVFECIDNGCGNTERCQKDAINYWKEVNPNEEYPVLVEGLFKGTALIIDKELYSI